jgi:CheY-like chemotaxis protein
MCSIRAGKKNLQLVFDRDEGVPRYVHADEMKLREVLINLIGNAIKFTETGSVTIKARKTEPESTSQSSVFKLHFDVADTGPGIAPEEMAHVFDAFGQTATGRQVQEGAGLGLPISRKFVQMMGGDIEVTSEVGQGTTVSIEIQARPVDAADMAPAMPTRRVVALEPGQPRYRMLIVDDIRDNRLFLVKLLSPFGFDLREAENGQEAIDIWKSWNPHLIWLDIRMPVLDGYEVIKRIRQGRARVSDLPEAKIIAVTASSFDEDRTAILSAGCDDFVKKPLHEQDIIGALHTHLGIRFLYEDILPVEVDMPPTGEKGKLIREALAALPADVLDMLEQGALSCDAQLLSEVMDRIRDHDAKLAGVLERLSEGYRYDEILALLKKAGPGASS